MKKGKTRAKAELGAVPIGKPGNPESGNIEKQMLSIFFVKNIKTFI